MAPATRADLGVAANGLSRLVGAVTGEGRNAAIDVIARSPRLFWGWVPFVIAVVPRSALPTADRELVTMRTAWNARSAHTWSQARVGRLSADDVTRVSQGPEAAGWTVRQAALLRATDELHADRRISDGTWLELAAHLDERRRIDLCFLVGLYEMLAMSLNSFGVGAPAPATSGSAPRRLRAGRPTPPAVPRPAGDMPSPPGPPSDRSTIRELVRSPHWKTLAQGPRMPPGSLRDIGVSAWALSRLLGWVNGSDGIRVIQHFAWNRRLAHWYVPFAATLVPGTSLPRVDVEYATLRTAWNVGCKYEWWHHVTLSAAAGLSDDDILRVSDGPDASGWSPRHSALVRAVDELGANRAIGDETWVELRSHYQERQLVELCFVVGHYEMLAMLLNSVGVVPEKGAYSRGPLRKFLRPGQLPA